MDFKSVAKSKSSNVTIGSNADSMNKNKKSFSNAAFQKSMLKKRGVYVEKKIESFTNTQEANNKQTKKKPPRRPRPGQTKFMTSVLTILSKSTTGTQHPETLHERDPKLKPQMKKTKKTKYKSRVLTNEVLKSEQDQLIVLQNKKEINQTPSSGTSIKPFNDLLKLTEVEPKRTIRDILRNNEVTENNTEVALQKKPKREKKLRIVDEPETMAAKIAKKEGNDIYDFLVNLLETSISVYKVKPDYDCSESRIPIEIDDSIIKKLDIKKDLPSPDNASPCMSRHKIETDTFDIDEPFNVKPEFYRTFKPKMKAKSLFNTNTKKTKPILKIKSFNNDEKYNKKQNKRDIIKLLKEELQKSVYNFNEPESLYDALKVIAKNKRRNEKTIHFRNDIKHKQYSDLDCRFDRRRVISFGAKKKKTQSKVPTSSRDADDQYFEEDVRDTFAFSRHSLEVIGYDYEAKPEGTKGENYNILLNYHSSSPSVSGLFGDSMINYHFDSSNSDISRFHRMGYNKY